VQFRRDNVGRCSVITAATLADAPAGQGRGLACGAEASSDLVVSFVEVSASALMRWSLPERNGRARCDAHAADCLSQRRQVDVARVTRRSHPGHVAEINRLALDQKTNVEAGIAPRQYTHETLSPS
jgi:hypothetical protein